jgi:pimeloyl-ACP methyl ester carboxylesterase
MSLQLASLPENVFISPGELIDGPEGTRLYVEAYGSIDAPRVMVLIPGGYQATTCYRRLIKQLVGQEFQVITWDPPTQGLSGPFEPCTNLPATFGSTCLHAVLSHFHVQKRRAILLGWSLGTTFLLQFLEQYPEARGFIDGVVLIAGLLSCASYFSYTYEHDRGLFDLLGHMQSQNPLESLPAINEFIDRLISKPVQQEDWYLLRGTTMFSFERWRYQGGIPLASLDVLPQEFLSSLSMPICFMQGRWDRLVPINYTRQMHKAVPGVFSYEYDCGHTPFLEVPDLVEKNLRSFLTNLW